MRITWPLGIALSIVVRLGALDIAAAQTGGCVLAAEHRGPDRVLRCGPGLTIHAASQTDYRPVGQPVSGVELGSGAVLIEFAPSAARKSFQILTPHAIAAVRGTKWAVDVTADKTSTLVIAGAVEVRRRQSGEAAVLHAGEGVDVSIGSGPLEVKRWKKERVRALLARFGR